MNVKDINFFIVFINLIIMFLSLYYFFNLSNLYIKIFMIEHQFLNFDGVLKLPFNYSIERILSSEEKIHFAKTVLEERFNLLSNNYPEISKNVSVEESIVEVQNNILNFNTLKEIKIYCITLSDQIFQKEIFENNINTTKSANNSYLYYGVLIVTL